MGILDGIIDPDRVALLCDTDFYGPLRPPATQAAIETLQEDYHKWSLEWECIVWHWNEEWDRPLYRCHDFEDTIDPNFLSRPLFFSTNQGVVQQFYCRGVQDLLRMKLKHGVPLCHLPGKQHPVRAAQAAYILDRFVSNCFRGYAGVRKEKNRPYIHSTPCTQTPSCKTCKKACKDYDKWREEQRRQGVASKTQWEDDLLVGVLWTIRGILHRHYIVPPVVYIENTNSDDGDEIVVLHRAVMGSIEQIG
jgi:hypothetical protein